MHAHARHTLLNSFLSKFIVVWMVNKIRKYTIIFTFAFASLYELTGTLMGNLIQSKKFEGHFFFFAEFLHYKISTNKSENSVITKNIDKNYTF